MNLFLFSVRFNLFFFLGLIEYALIGAIIINIGLLVIRSKTIMDYMKDKNPDHSYASLFVLFRKTGTFILAYGVLKIVNAVISLLEISSL